MITAPPSAGLTTYLLNLSLKLSLGEPLPPLVPKRPIQPVLLYSADRPALIQAKLKQMHGEDFAYSALAWFDTYPNLIRSARVCKPALIVLDGFVPPDAAIENLRGDALECNAAILFSMPRPPSASASAPPVNALGPVKDLIAKCDVVADLSEPDGESGVQTIRVLKSRAFTELREACIKLNCETLWYEFVA